jgi:metal-sulfur cluster biosynthetic enzyme
MSEREPNPDREEKRTRASQEPREPETAAPGEPGSGAPPAPASGPPRPEPGSPAAPAPAREPAASSPTQETAAPAPAASAAAAGAPSQQEMAIRSALETVMDPEIGLSVIDLGLIREVRLEPGRTDIKMMLTTPFCPYAPQMIADVKAAAQSVVPQDCEVEILPDAWSPEMMPDPGLLGFSY